MDTKTKILKVLPYWLVGLILTAALQLSLPLMFLAPQGSEAAAVQADAPQVLGAATSLRGEIPPQPAELKITGIANTGNVSAKNYIVFDLDTGATLLGKNVNQQLQIASLTKLMTALVAYQNVDLNKSFVIGAKDILNISPSLGLKSGDSVKALDVFNSMLVGSCNDAALALADYVSQTTGESFVDLMNRRATALGMTNTKFSNPMGFDSQNNFSSAGDLELLISAIQKLSAFTDLGRRNGYKFASVGGNIYNTEATNKLLQSHSDIYAIKTGFTNEAHGAMATEIILDGHHVVILVLDSQNREADTLKLKENLEKAVIK